MHTPTRESAAPTPPALEELQEALPQYEILALIGRGGMGAVYRARQRSLNREVAIKVLRAEALDEFRLPDRFRTEAHAMARLNHPAIVHVHDFGETAGGILYIVMEFVQGTDLHRVLDERSPLSSREALAIAIEVCAALEYAHGCGIVHRDIKPGNVLLTAGGHVKVADFGLAKMIDLAAAARLTAPDLTFGTANYAAPEALRPNAPVDHRADLYAAGVMLYQMLTGLLPRGMFRLPSQKSECDPRLDAIVCRALETEPADRFQSAHEMGLALTAIQDSPAPASSAPVVPSRRKPALAPALLGSLILLALAAHSLIGKKSTPPRPDTKARATSPQAATATQPPSAEARVIDLLAAVELKRDALDPGWLRDANGLALTGTAADERWGPRLQLPYQPPAEYEVTTEFTPTSEGHAILQLLSAQGRGFAFVLGRRGTAQWTSGFEGYDRLSTSKLTPTATLIPANLETGRRYRSRLEVRAGSLRAWLDDKPLIDWQGDFKHLGSSDPLPEPARELAKTESPSRGKLHDMLHLGLRSFRDVTFHKIEVREISGPGKLEAPLPAAADGWQDLLPEINPSRHTLTGRWRFEQKELTNTYSTGATALIELPLKGAVNYDLRLNLRYLEKYTGHLAFTLPHGERTGRFVIDDYRSPNAGLEYVDGRSRLDVAGVARQRTAFLPQGEPCELLFQVRDEGLRVSLNGSELYRWAGDWSRVTTVPAVPENQSPRPFLGLGCKDGKVTVSAVAARLITGPGGEKLPPAEAHGPPTPAAISLLPPSTPLEYQGHRYQYVPGAFTWPTARKNAEQMGGHLVTIHDAAEQDWLWRTYSRFLPAQSKTNIHSRGWWTGGMQPAENAEWKWSTGEPFTFVSWAINEPGRNRSGAYYVLHHGSATNATDSAWTARPPTVTSGFVVEWDSPAPTKAAQASPHDFAAEVAAAPPAQQVELVVAKTKALNPGAEFTVDPSLQTYGVTGLGLRTSAGLLADISPVKALPQLRKLRLEHGGVPDISCLQGMQIVDLVVLSGNLRDLSTLATLPLEALTLNGVPGDDFTPLQGLKLERLSLGNCQRLRDLEFVKGMRLLECNVENTRVTDLSPLAGMPLEQLWYNRDLKVDPAFLRSFPNLKRINGQPAAEVLAALEANDRPVSSTAVDDAFLREVAAAPAERQVELVMARLRALNPGADLKADPVIRFNMVTSLELKATAGAVTNIAPVAALRSLHTLRLENLLRVSDLSCLAGLPLKDIVMRGGAVRDFSVLAGMPLEAILVSAVPAEDFSALRGKKIERLSIGNCPLRDLSFVQGMQLRECNVFQTDVRDLTPLAGMPLEQLWYNADLHIAPAFLRSFPNLKRINGRPAAEVLAELDAKPGPTAPSPP